MNTQNNKKKKNFLSIYEMTVFAFLGTLMFCSKIIMEVLPNIHLLGMFIMVFTIAFRRKALIPIYVFVFLTGIYAGFNLWWIPYLYIWAVFWGITMLLPENMSKTLKMIIYPIVCGLFGLFYGTLYAPSQALLFGMDFKKTVAWIISGLPFDVLHSIGNFCAGFLVLPFSELLKKLWNKGSLKV